MTPEQLFWELQELIEKHISNLTEEQMERLADELEDPGFTFDISRVLEKHLD